MSSRDSNWKKHLLRTSVPLEHEAASLLSSRGFGVSADYSYYRMDGAVEKEFSVDVRGVKSSASGTRTGGECLFDVFVECKYRDRGTVWLFLPAPRHSSGDLADVIEAVDLFAPKFVHGRWDLRDPKVTTCYTAVEIGSSHDGEEKSKGRAFDSQLRHGVRQLQYAVPSLIMLRARAAALLAPEETHPFFFSQILLTNARLLVAEPTFGIASVEQAESLESVGTEVPFLLWEADVGPDFYHHCQRQFSALTELATTPSMRAIEEVRRKAREASWVLPSALARRIAVDPTHAIHIASFKNVLVVNIAHLGGILDFLGSTFIRLSESLKDEPITKW